MILRTAPFFFRFHQRASRGTELHVTLSVQLTYTTAEMKTMGITICGTAALTHVIVI